MHLQDQSYHEYVRMKKHTVHVFFHAPCFDGIVSAVLMSAFLESHDRNTRVRLHPVGYELKAQWRKRRLPPRSAVVDFLYHPDADWWIDHHATTFVSKAWRRRYERKPKGSHLYDPSAPSCASVVSSYLKGVGFDTSRYRHLVAWADTIDAAAYRQPSDAILARSAALRINQSLAAGGGPQYAVWLVERLKRKSLSAVASMARVKTGAAAVTREMTKGIRAVRSVARMEPGGIVVFDVPANVTVVNRYTPYYLFPNARYSVGVIRDSHGAKLTAMRNPWRVFPSTPIGPLLAKYGGGGHTRVGSVLLSGKNADSAPRILREVVAALK
jgi:hypothetical protein